jgi:hypothetical protein
MSLMMALVNRLLGTPGPSPQLVQRLRERGRQAQAELISASRTNTYITSGPEYSPRAQVWRLHLIVRPEGAPRFEADVKEPFPMNTGPIAGSSFPVVFDPDKPTDLMVDDRAGARIPTSELDTASVETS